MIYDFNDMKFIKKLNKEKIKITLTYTEKSISIQDKFYFHNKIKYILFSNCILNNDIYCDYINDILDIDFSILKERITIIEINKKHYDYAFLRKYIPYMIDVNVNDNEYYLFNRDYQIIDITEKNILLKIGKEIVYIYIMTAVILLDIVIHVKNCLKI